MWDLAILWLQSSMAGTSAAWDVQCILYGYYSKILGWELLFGVENGQPQVMQPEKAIWVFRMPVLGGCVFVHGNGKEALQHFDWISERTHTVNSYHYSLPSVRLQPSRLGWWRHALLFYDDPQTGKGKRSAVSVHGDTIVKQNSIVWPNVKLALEFRSSKEWFCILGLVYATE
jgi:hypothetical protein